MVSVSYTRVTFVRSHNESYNVSVARLGVRIWFTGWKEISARARLAIEPKQSRQRRASTEAEPPSEFAGRLLS